jgi:pimeloyl-ACP methyl ester carboxylesterase
MTTTRLAGKRWRWVTYVVPAATESLHWRDYCSIFRKKASGPVVLVGHAYAGAVIAGPTDERIKSLVYIAALAPGDGETVAQVFYREKPHPEAPHLEPDRYGFIWMPEEGFRNAVAHKASAEQKIIAAAVQRPIAVKCIQEVTPTPAWRTKPTWYLLAEEDRMISPTTQRFIADRMGAKIHSHPVDRSPMYAAANLVVDIISEAVREKISSGKARSAMGE